MSTISLDATTVRPSHISRWSQVLQSLAEWQHCTRSCHELRNLSDKCLQDIGVPRIARFSRCTSDFDACKPFWMA
jgi:uncharacterized protein YjiS (DUF1127 family)